MKHPDIFISHPDHWSAASYAVASSIFLGHSHPQNGGAPGPPGPRGPENTATERPSLRAAPSVSPRTTRCEWDQGSLPEDPGSVPAEFTKNWGKMEKWSLSNLSNLRIKHWDVTNLVTFGGFHQHLEISAKINTILKFIRNQPLKIGIWSQQKLESNHHMTYGLATLTRNPI